MGYLLCSRSQAQSIEETGKQHFLWERYRRGPGHGIRESYREGDAESKIPRPS